MGKHRVIEGITSDIMFEAEGKDLSELLKQASLALFEVMCQIKKVKPKKAIDVKIKASNIESLVHKWLARLITEFGINEMFFSKFKIKVQKKANKFIATGKLYGEPISPSKSGIEVKGVTYHNFKVEKTKKGYKATVVVDI